MSEGFGCFEIASVLMFYLGSFVSLFGFGFLLTGVLYIYIYICMYVYVCVYIHMYIYVVWLVYMSVNCSLPQSSSQ